MYRLNLLWPLLLQVATTFAQFTTTCFDGNVCYRLNIPQQTADDGQGDIFLQVTAPTAFSWVAIGQGSGMAGSHMFIVYAASADNVTVSPRLGVGEVEPVYTPDTQLTVLEGSGIADGVMTANIRCSNCESWSGGSMSFSAASAQWIHAAHAGPPLDSTSPTERLSQHNAGDSHFDWDMSTAVGGSSLNPFVDAATAPSPSDNPIINTITEPFPPAVLLAHAVCACLAMLLLFPLGSISIRIPGIKHALYIHAGIQLTALLTLTAGAACGIYVAAVDGYLRTPHAIIGLVVLSLLLLVQPLLGMLHHRRFAQLHRRTSVSHMHIWLGRGAITLGIVNGGLGLQLTGGNKEWNIVYGVVAAVVWVSWMGVAGWAEVRRVRGQSAGVENRGGIGKVSGGNGNGLGSMESVGSGRGMAA
ncbi:CBD9-like protein [Pseudovirgaria hyperparasitica]|uniref:CBD9-like protein n=1 Tax=Pseudovirgaria hyperparasitica TaxID=470096 RepID=A0A6A6W4X0_9PEZI|nr:CBD9-like protein [Pseudovirgaria hyperparasitica]KAF2757605.1 CBD9-like protein [Pseudovirgaria hyperparasitica]